ncbi:MAG TPA: DMT family transporter [Sphingomonas sp.]|nr:DMT family transporter [Sphingomonas sp.]
MPAASLALVILAALIHATWNLFAKRAAHAGPAFILAYSLISSIAYAPVAIWMIAQGELPWTVAALGFVALGGVLHIAYNLALQRGYRVADLSVVYPVARGTGPALSSIGAFLLLGEVPDGRGLAGLLAVIAGIALIATDGRLAKFREPGAMRGIQWGLITGALIASYSVADGYAVKVLLIAPLVLDWATNVFRSALIAPAARGNWRSAMAGHWRGAWVIGLLSPLGYILVLTALRWGAPLHIVAPTRETSMMIGTLFGMVFLGEPVGKFRLLGCAILVGGVVLLAA